MKQYVVCAVALAACLTITAVAAGEVDVQARSWAATCTGCHGTNGHSEGRIPAIAGRSQEEIVRLMIEFREGQRAATVMHQHAKGYTDAQIERIAAFFTAQ